MSALLEIEDLRVAFGELVVVDGVSLAVDAGERLGLIGESGSGKTLTALAAIGLLPDAARATGSVRLDGRELLGAGDRDLARVRGEQVAMVFQDPGTSLNPTMRIAAQTGEALRLHRGASRRDARRAALGLLERVGLSDAERFARAYPHELSGGQRQRVGLAIALACDPALLIADEPTTALDVTVQAAILGLLDELVDAQRTALLFITHDLAVAARVCRRLLVMEGGRAVESGDVDALLRAPATPYTRALVAAARATTLAPTAVPA